MDANREFVTGKPNQPIFGELQKEGFIILNSGEHTRIGYGQ